MKNKVCVIGATNFVVISKIESELKDDDSICGDISIRFGGVGRHIAVNLAQIGDVNVEFVTALSNDIIGIMAKNEFKESNISVDHSFFAEKWASYYCETICATGHYGINDMRLINNITPEYISSIKSKIEGVSYIVIDTNLSEESIVAITNTFDIPVICDTTSIQKCRKILNVLNKIEIIKMNYDEACTICNIEIESTPNVEKLVNELRKLPINKAIVTLGKFGSFFISQSEFYLHKISDKADYKNVLGAGDVFTANIIKGTLMAMPVKKLLEHCSLESEKLLKRNNA
jgi:pseudouridine kinase